MTLNGLLCRPGNQPGQGFYACEEQAVCEGSGEMELIPRPLGLDLLPSAYTDWHSSIPFDMLCVLFFLEMEVDRPPLLISG